MGEAVAALCALMFVLLVLVWVIGVPIYLILRTQQLSELRDRLRLVERELEMLHRGEKPVHVEPIPVLEAVETATELAAHAPSPAQVQAKPRRERERLPQAPREPAPSFLAGIDFEAWIGKRGLGWIAVVLLIFATAFFVKQAFDSDLIGNLGRVALGVLAGAGLCAAGYLCHVRGYRVFTQMLTSAGIVLLYLTTFASFGYYSLMPQAHAGLFFVLIVAQAAALAWLYDAPPIAIMAVVGGLLTPLLLHTGHDRYQSLFTYLIILNLSAGALVLLRRHWYAVGTIALLGTQGLFWIWYAENYHPEKLQAAPLFQAVLFALYLTPSFLAASLRRAATLEDLLRLLLNATLFTVAGYILLDEKYHPWMGVFVVGVAIVYAAVGWLIALRNANDRRHLLVVVAAVLGLVAMVFPIQAKAAWIGLGWAVEGALLWWFGLRIRTVTLRAYGVVLLVMAVWRLVLIDTLMTGHEGPFVPLFNKYGLPATLIAVCVLFCAAVSRLSKPGMLSLDQFGLWFAGVGGVLLLWLIVSFETYDYFEQQIDRRIAVRGAMVDAQGRDLWQVQQDEVTRLRSYAWMTLSGVWALYATVILTLGFLRRNRPLRWTALGIFGVTLMKVVFVDTAELRGYYRVGAFFVLAVMMGLGAWIYQRIQLTRPSAEREGVPS